MNPDQKKISVKKKKKICSVIGCFINAKIGNFCTYHHGMIFNKEPKQKVEARLDTKLSQNKKTKKTPTKSPYQRALTACDTAFSKYVRLYYSDKNGWCRCWTCPNMYFWTDKRKRMHCGHFQSRRYLSTRFVLQNVGPQCISCNSFDQGRQQLFAQKIDEKWPEGTAGKMLVDSRLERHYAVFELKELTKFFNSEVKRLKKEKGL